MSAIETRWISQELADGDALCGGMKTKGPGTKDGIHSAWEKKGRAPVIDGIRTRPSHGQVRKPKNERAGHGFPTGEIIRLKGRQASSNVPEH